MFGVSTHINPFISLTLCPTQAGTVSFASPLSENFFSTVSAACPVRLQTISPFLLRSLLSHAAYRTESLLNAHGLCLSLLRWSLLVKYW